MKKIFAEFREFIDRGSVIDLAVGVVIGAAFTAVITSFVNRILMQFVAAIFGKPNFSDLFFRIGNNTTVLTGVDGKPLPGNPTVTGTPIYYGDFITALITFFFVALALFFVVKAYNHLKERSGRAVVEEEATEVDLLTEIRDLMRSQNQS